jgi:hypothetical protein
MFNKQKIITYILIGVGVLLVVFFGMRAFHSFTHIRGKGPFKPRHEASETDFTLIREWMTVPYISKAYGVPGEVLFDKLNISPKNNFEKSLKQLNDEFYPNEDGVVLLYVQAAVQAFEFGAPPPPFPSTPMPTPLVIPTETP